jgi:hypothetical protein
MNGRRQSEAADYIGPGRRGKRGAGALLDKDAMGNSGACVAKGRRALLFFVFHKCYVSFSKGLPRKTAAKWRRNFHPPNYYRRAFSAGGRKV